MMNDLKIPPTLAALILVAGYSSRMGSFRPLLPFGSGCVSEAVP